MSALLCSLLLLLPLLSVLILEAHRFSVRREMHERLEEREEEALQTVRLPADGFHWYKEGKEIRIGNELFDVKSWKVAGGEIIVTGLYDRQETALEDWLKAQADESDDSDSLLRILLLAQSPAQPGAFSFRLSSLSLFRIHHLSYNDPCSSRTLPVLLQPPRS